MKLSYWQTYQQACRMFAEAHFTLREWVTNSDMLMSHLQLDGMAVHSPNNATNLMMNWQPGQDVLTYPPKSFAQLPGTHTKRTLLSRASQLLIPWF